MLQVNGIVCAVLSWPVDLSDQHYEIIEPAFFAVLKAALIGAAVVVIFNLGILLARH